MNIGNDPSIEAMRKEMDSLDEELARLLNKRYVLGKLIVSLKRGRHMPDDDGLREREILTHAKELAPDISDEILGRIYSALFDASKGKKLKITLDLFEEEDWNTGGFRTKKWRLTFLDKTITFNHWEEGMEFCRKLGLMGSLEIK